MKLITFYLSIIFLSTLFGCAGLPTDYQADNMVALPATHQTTLAKKTMQFRQKIALQEKIKQLPEKNSLMILLNHGVDAFYARINLMAMAEQSIDMQYYIWQSDIIGRSLLNEMILAADRGVRVRLLLDDFNLDETTLALVNAVDQHPNIYIKLFNPFANRNNRQLDFLTDAARINHRMHNKSFSVDNQIAIVGGRNIGNEYFSADESAIFIDLDVMTAGPDVQKVEQQFDIYWNSEISYPVKAFSDNQATWDDLENVKIELSDYINSLSESPYAKDMRDSSFYKAFSSTKLIESPPSKLPLFHGNVQILYDSPQKALGKKSTEVTYLKSQLIPHIAATSHTFELISPYFVPGEVGVSYLTEMVKHGVKVRVLTNSLSSTDSAMAQSGYARHRYELLKAGVELYELRPDITSNINYNMRKSGNASTGLHAKTYIWDRQKIFIGSFNFDQRSANINSEVGLLYDSENMAKHVAKFIFNENIKNYAFQVKLKQDSNNPTNEHIIWVEHSNNKIIEYNTDPYTSFWRRFTENFYSILPVESQL